jgi:hypothetical protein
MIPCACVSSTENGTALDVQEQLLNARHLQRLKKFLFVAAWGGREGAVALTAIVASCPARVRSKLVGYSLYGRKYLAQKRAGALSHWCTEPASEPAPASEGY